MRTAPAWGLCLGAVMVLSGCGGDVVSGGTGDTGTGTGTGPGSGGGGSSGTGGAGGAGGAGAEWKAIITANWELASGTEKTSDIHIATVDKDTYIGGIRPIAPTGTHHTVLALGGLGMGNIIYASGVNTNALMFPEGVGLKVPAGETIVLQLHLFNPTAENLTGTSGIEIIEVDPSAIQHEADLFLPGPFDFNIPPNQEYTHAGTCTATTKQNVFAIFPHMHQFGSHFKSTLTVGGVNKVIHDDAYDFNHQAFIPFEPIALEPGDSVTTECTWKNTTAQTVGWGESSTTEMCFSILYRYPAQGGGTGFCDE